MANLKKWTIALLIAISNLVSGQDRFCFTRAEAEAMAYRDLRATKLENDSIEMAKAIERKNNEIAIHKSIENDLKEQNKAQTILANNYKQTAYDFQAKYTKSQDKVKRRGGIIIGSLTVNILFITIVAIKVL